MATAALVAALVGAMVPGSFASSNAQDTNPGNAFATTSLYSPTALSGGPFDHQIGLTWTLPAHNNGNGLLISAVNIGVNSSTACSTNPAAYTPTASVVKTATSYADTSGSGYDPTYEGSYNCYLIQTAYQPSGPAPGWVTMPPWTSTDTVTPLKAEIGFDADTLTLANGGTAGGVLDSGDTVTLHFDQPTNQPASFTGLSVCAQHSSSTIWLAQPGSTSTCGGTGSLGKLTGGTLSSTGNADGRYNATYTWVNSSTLRVSIGSLAAGRQNTLGAGTWSFTPTSPAPIRTSDATITLCVSNPVHGKCLPTTTGLP